MKIKFRLLSRLRHIRLYDTTGLTQDVQLGLNIGIISVTLSMVFANITTGAAWTGYQRLLGANALTLGIISAIPVAASALQIFASYVLEKWQARRLLFLLFGIISRVAWLGIALIPVLLPATVGDLRLYALMVLLALSAAGGSFLNVSFFSLMGDLVPMRIRGRYFSGRQAVSLLAGILTGMLVSFLMDRVTGFTGYVIVLIVAAVFGIADICCFFWVRWPAMHRPEGRREGFMTMFKSVLKDKEYMKIVWYFTFWSFAVNICGPFGNVYFMEYVKMSFTEITLLNQILPNIATVLVIGWWGRQIDRYGSQPVVQTAGLYCMLLPITYLFVGPRSFFILPVAHALSGMSWPASDLGTQNMYLFRAPQHNRSMYVAVFFACTQLFGVAFSNLVGGILMSGPLLALQDLNWSLAGFPMSRFSYLYLITGILRMISVLLLLPHLKSLGETPAPTMVKELFAQNAGRIRQRLHSLRVKRIRTQYRKKEEKQGNEEEIS